MAGTCFSSDQEISISAAFAEVEAQTWLGSAKGSASKMKRLCKAHYISFSGEISNITETG